MQYCMYSMLFLYVSAKNEERQVTSNAVIFILNLHTVGFIVFKNKS